MSVSRYHDKGRGGYTPRVDRTSSVLDNGNLNKVAVKHNQVTYYFAPRPPVSGERELKARVYKDTVMVVLSWITVFRGSS